MQVGAPWRYIAVAREFRWGLKSGCARTRAVKKESACPQIPVAGLATNSTKSNNRMSTEKNLNNLATAAAELVLRELNEIETRDIFGGSGQGWVKVGPITPVPPVIPEQMK